MVKGTLLCGIHGPMPDSSGHFSFLNEASSESASCLRLVWEGEGTGGGGVHGRKEQSRQFYFEFILSKEFSPGTSL